MGDGRVDTTEYESIWSGRDSLALPEAPAAPRRLCPECWVRRPVAWFLPQRRACRLCRGVRKSRKNRRLSEKARRAGLCMVCLHRPLAENRSTCARCAAAGRRRVVERGRRLARERRCRLCTGGLPVGWRRRHCAACLEALRVRHRARRRALAAAGLCDCGAPRAAKRGGGLAVRCRRCLDRSAELMRERRRKGAGGAAASG